MTLALLKGLSVTFRTMFRKPITIEYPDVQRPVSRRFKGRHALKRYDNGLERCIGCSLCSAACPADAILVVPDENTEAERFSPGERYARIYEINMIRCIFCGFCEEACPVDAIVLEHSFELAVTDRDSTVFTKDMLIDSPDDHAEDTPQDSRGRDIVLRLGGTDYFRLADSADGKGVGS